MLQLKGLTAVPDTRPLRRARLLKPLERLGAEAFAISHLPNVRYLCGYTGSNGVLLVSGRSATLFTDPRYALQAADECDCRVKVATGSLWPEVAKAARRMKAGRLALESEKLAHSQWLALALEFGKAVKLVPAVGLVEQLRAVKSAAEIAAIRASGRLCSTAYEHAVENLQPGATERDLAAELDFRMRTLGADGPSFETIVACGKRSALPHASPTAAKLRPGQLLLVDMGASLAGYASDMTRVVHLGRASGRMKSLYAAVLEAQLAAIGQVKAGVGCHEVDAAARKALRKRGLDKYFTHSTGHGLGLEIHELPRVGAKNHSALEAGMVITIEPGVYLKDFGGVRIEDTVLVTESGVEVLTPTTKEFLGIAL